MDTKLGVIELTEKQISRLNDLKDENIKGFSYWHDKKEVVVVSDTEVDVEALRTAVASLPDEYTQDELVIRFNAETAIGREAQVFSAEELIRLMPVSYTLNELIRFKNFAGLKGICEALVLGGQILQSDYDKLAGILAEQGVAL
jgi:hypothetical protein